MRHSTFCFCLSVCLSRLSRQRATMTTTNHRIEIKWYMIISASALMNCFMKSARQSPKLVITWLRLVILPFFLRDFLINGSSILVRFFAEQPRDVGGRRSGKGSCPERISIDLQSSRGGLRNDPCQLWGSDLRVNRSSSTLEWSASFAINSHDFRC